MNPLWLDLRLALRGLRKSPGFAAVAIVTIALGVGANVAIYSLVHAPLLASSSLQPSSKFPRLSAYRMHAYGGTPCRIQPPSYLSNRWYFTPY